MEPHRRNHAARARPCNNSGTSRTFAAANPRRNEAVSSEKRPPTSLREHNQPSPASVANQLWVTRLFSTSCNPEAHTAHNRTAWLALLHPPLSRADQGRVDCQLCSLGRGAVRQTTTSSLLVSNWFTTPRSISRTKTLVRTLPPASRQILAAAFSRGNPLRPSVPATAQADR